MAFIPSYPEIGDTIILNQDVEVIKGTFTDGTRLKVIGFCEHGINLIDEDGNQLLEFGRLGESYTLVKQ